MAAKQAAAKPAAVDALMDDVRVARLRRYNERHEPVGGEPQAGREIVFGPPRFRKDGRVFHVSFESPQLTVHPSGKQAMEWNPGKHATLQDMQVPGIHGKGLLIDPAHTFHAWRFGKSVYRAQLRRDASLIGHIEPLHLELGIRDDITVYHGQCPAIVVDEVMGHAYAFPEAQRRARPMEMSSDVVAAVPAQSFWGNPGVTSLLRSLCR